MFAKRHMTWIEKVGVDSLMRYNLTVHDFVKGLEAGMIMFDELCITIACRAFNIHAVILLDTGYWSTKPSNDYSNCLLKLAFMGYYGFKELSSQTEMIFGEDESSEEEGLTDLEDTGLFGGSNSEHDSSVASENYADDDVDVKPDMDTLIPFSTTFTTTAEHPINLVSDDDDVDVKPKMDTLVPFSTTFMNSPEHPINLVSDEDDVDVKPDVNTLNLFTTKITNTKDNPIDLVSDDNADPKAPATSKVQRVKRTRIYSCYICRETFTMQSSFVKHHYEHHVDSKFKCEFCESFFETENGLFKHERSHLYMKHICKDCGKFFQFPYQLQAHVTQHTGVGKHGCAICNKEFSCKTSKDFHERTHSCRVKCDSCLMTTTKEFKSVIALHLHQRGMHGPGWTTLCNINYKWKSQYTKHNKSDCKICTKKKADIKLARFKFLAKVDLSRDQ